MRLVLGARPITQHLQTLAMFDWPAQQAGDARFDPLDQIRFTALKKCASTGAVAVFFFATRSPSDRQRPRQARCRSSHQGLAFCVAKKAFEHQQ